MIIKEILCDKKKYLDLLLIGDEQESMILKYLDKSRILGLYDPELKAICAVEHMPDKSEKVVEIKNIAVYPKYHHKGYGTKLLLHILSLYKSEADKILVGTGENEQTLRFYKKQGFMYSHTLKNFFIQNYDHPIYENGKQLVDMIYLSINLKHP